MADDQNPTDQYAPEAGNLGPLRFMYSVPFGAQLAAAAQAAGAKFRGDADSFSDSYKFHRGQNDRALAALSGQPSGTGWEMASQIPYMVAGPAGAAAYAGTASATRGDPLHEAALRTALMATPSNGPAAPTMAAPIKLPGGGEKPFPEFEEVGKGFRLPDGSIKDTGPFHDLTKLPEPYNKPENADFLDDGFILTGMRTPQKKNGFIVTGGERMPDHFVKRSDFNNPDKTRPEAWGLPEWQSMKGNAPAANEEMSGYQQQAPATVSSLDVQRLIKQLRGGDPAAKEAIDSLTAPQPSNELPSDSLFKRWRPSEGESPVPLDPNAFTPAPKTPEVPYSGPTPGELGGAKLDVMNNEADTHNWLNKMNGQPTGLPPGGGDQEFQQWLMQFLQNAGPAAASNQPIAPWK